ncbi:MAG: glycosyltransferase family 2 protein [Bacteroidales bacterium]|nr:glycosyltransferase family 2 protein [Bacteroidales bacterium]
MKAAVVILNWNTRDYLRKFLPGLIASTEGLDAEVIVADNASTDGSPEMLAAEFPDVRRISLDRNYGFTGGYNRALAQVEAEYFVLINSDIEVPQGWLKPLTDWMDTHPHCGACGPKLLSYDHRDRFEYAGAAGGLLDRYGYPFCRGRILQKVEKDEGQYDTPEDVFWVSGACLLVRSKLWKKLGGLDDRFFAHMEEIDLCWRMQLSGYTVTVVPESFVYHIGGGTLPNESPFKLRLNFRNNLLLLENNLAKTFRAQGYSVDGSLGKARRRIFVRMLLDGASALTYLVTKRYNSYKAVVQAHGEYRKLRRKPTPDEVAMQKDATVRGWYDGWIVPKGIFRK